MIIEPGPADEAWLDRYCAAAGFDPDRVVAEALTVFRAWIESGRAGYPTPAGACAACSRALRPCEWCGSAEVLRGPHGQRWPVVVRPGWDGAWHDPCHDAEAAELARCGVSATLTVAMLPPDRGDKRRQGA